MQFEQPKKDGFYDDVQIQDEYFAIFKKLVFAITSRMLRIQMEHIENVCSLGSKLFLSSKRSILEVIAKTSFSKIGKCSTLLQIINSININSA